MVDEHVEIENALGGLFSQARSVEEDAGDIGSLTADGIRKGEGSRRSRTREFLGDQPGEGRSKIDLVCLSGGLGGNDGFRDQVRTNWMV